MAKSKSAGRKAIKVTFEQQSNGWRAHVPGGDVSEAWGRSIAQWAISTVALIATALAPLQLLLGSARWGWVGCGVAVVGWIAVARSLEAPSPATADVATRPTESTPRTAATTAARTPASSPHQS